METLQSLCIDVIVDKFDRYFSAFCKSDDATFIRKFEFLQRKYSFEIITQLHKEDKMEEQYIDFLVNKYIKVLDTDWFNCSWETVCSKLKEVGPNIQKMLFYLTNIVDTMPWKDAMCYLSNLEVVTFNCACNNEFLEGIAKFCPNIMEINASFSDISDEGVISLCSKENGMVRCPKLKKLFISNCHVTDEGVEHAVKYLPLLEEIDHPDLPRILYSLHKNDISSLDKIKPYNLNTLNLLRLNHLSYYNDLLKICLFVCPRLKTLFCSVLQEDHLELFSSLTELEKLHLECHSIENINDLFKLIGKKLTSLKVIFGSVSICAIAENCTHLKCLHLSQVTFQKMDKKMPEFLCLDTCVFDSIEYNCEGANVINVLLKSSPKLEYIGFKRCNLSSSELKIEILKCCETRLIKKINFSASTVEVEFVKDILLNCYSLETIILENSNIFGADEYDLYTFAEILPNKPEIIFSDDLSSSDMEEDLHDIFEFDYDFEDPEYFPYDDYGDDDDDDDDDFNIAYDFDDAFPDDDF